MKRIDSPYEIISLEISQALKKDSGFCLKPQYEKDLKKKLADLKELIDEYLWDEELFFYTHLGPAETGLSLSILAPCSTLGTSSPYLLIPKKGLTLKTARRKDHFDHICISSLEEIKKSRKLKKDLKEFIEINQITITKHWAQITDSYELCREIINV